MLSVDASGLADSLKKAEQEIERRLVGMLGKFMQNFTATAVEKTPYGDDSESNPAEGKFRYLYLQRQAPLPQEAGMSRANWQIMNTDSFSPVYIADTSGYPSILDARETYYKLGETYYLGNATPYIQMLEENHSRHTNGLGISGPVMDEVLSIYQYQLDDYYKQS